MTAPARGERRALMEDEDYLEGVRLAIPDDLPDGARMAMMEEYGLDPLEDIIDFEEAQPVIRCAVCGKAFKSESAKQMHIRDLGHTRDKNAPVHARTLRGKK